MQQATSKIIIMNTKLYVGESFLRHSVTENDLQDLFSQHGPVSEVNLITDRMNGRSRGFAFVTMSTPEGAQAAISALASGQQIGGRALTVNEARPVKKAAAVAVVVAADVARDGPRGPRRENSRY